MTGPTNCPNCGAPIGMDDRCSYCGTMFLDVSHIPLDEPFYLRVRTSGRRQLLVTSRVVCVGVSIEDIAVDTVPRIAMEFMPTKEPYFEAEELKTER